MSCLFDRWGRPFNNTQLNEKVDNKVTPFQLSLQYDLNATSSLNTTGDDPQSNYTTYNIAEWIGMEKAVGAGLPLLLKGYIGIITISTLRGIIIVRQMFHRRMKGQSLKTPLIMFPNISRKDADKGLIECLKFLFNYGFYKFGLEFCFMGVIALISTRLDFYSVLYAIWLGLLYCFRRPTVAKLWPIFQCFGIITLPIQYFIVFAPPTWLCIHYPWDEKEVYRKLQEWMFLPDPQYPPNAQKLLCDFFLLMMITRQRLVFYIETTQKGSPEEYPGGHNYSVFMDIEKPHFVNPTSDFVSQAHTWLDVLKRGILSSLLWISLSIMFLAGTKRTNLFSLGYLIGAFVFLWQGSDFYLRPIKTILKWWNVLIGYNITVIMLKSILQGIGCLFIGQVCNLNIIIVDKKFFDYVYQRKISFIFVRSDHMPAGSYSYWESRVCKSSRVLQSMRTQQLKNVGFPGKTLGWFGMPCALPFS